MFIRVRTLCLRITGAGGDHSHCYGRRLRGRAKKKCRGWWRPGGEKESQVSLKKAAKDCRSTEAEAMALMLTPDEPLVEPYVHYYGERKPRGGCCLQVISSLVGERCLDAVTCVFITGLCLLLGLNPESHEHR